MSSSQDLGKREKTKASRRAQVMRAVREIESRIAEPLEVGKLATIAGMSKFHFQRAFRAVVGETVNQHIGRLRAERAASFLKYSSWQVGDIALACGFKTQSSFGRCFRKIYGMSPQEFRKAEGTVPFLRGYVRSRPGLELAQNSVPQPTVRIKDWPELRAICLRYYGPLDGGFQPWRELLAWAKKELPTLESSRFFGIWFDDWTGHEEHYRYECAIVTPNKLTKNPPEPFHLRIIPGGRTAVAEAQGRWLHHQCEDRARTNLSTPVRG
ncbi:MAG: AraC family transcriptional regulator [Verrucomicrobiota bacterium]